jgi:hypothetical protein
MDGPEPRTDQGPAPGTKDYHSRRGTRWTPRFARSIDSDSAPVAENGQKIDDGRQWLRSQLDGGAPSLAPPDGVTATAIGEALRGIRMAGQGDEQERRQARRRVVEMSQAEMHAALTARITTERPFVERLVAFWSNHLCVSTGSKMIVAPLAGSYERDVIRAHVLGRFEDMVLASAKHPAMLVYLDNFQSIGPNSRGAGAGQRNNGQRRGLNENYARELLELHTLGCERRLHAAGRAGAREDSHRLDDQRTERAGRAAAASEISRAGGAAPRQRPAAIQMGRSSSRSSICCTSPARKRCWGSATARAVSRKASA